MPEDALGPADTPAGQTTQSSPVATADPGAQPGSKASPDPPTVTADAGNDAINAKNPGQSPNDPGNEDPGKPSPSPKQLGQLVDPAGGSRTVLPSQPFAGPVASPAGEPSASLSEDPTSDPNNSSQDKSQNHPAPADSQQDSNPSVATAPSTASPTSQKDTPPAPNNSQDPTSDGQEGGSNSAAENPSPATQNQGANSYEPSVNPSNQDVAPNSEKQRTGSKSSEGVDSEQDIAPTTQPQGSDIPQADPDSGDAAVIATNGVGRPTTIKLGGQSATQQTTIQLVAFPNASPDTPGVGGLIYSALGYAGPIVEPSPPTTSESPKAALSDARTTAPPPNIAAPNLSGDPSPANPTADAITFPQIVTAAGQELTILNPSAVVVASSTISVGGPAATVAGTLMSLAASGNLVLGRPTEDTAAAEGPSLFTIAGQALTANPSGTAPSILTIAGTVLSAGGPAATVSDTPISLASGGDLIVGGGAATANIPGLYTLDSDVFISTPNAFMDAGTTLVASASANRASAANMPSSVFTAADQTFTANPTAFAVATMTISAGGSSIVVSGTPISLAPSGTLIIGSSTYILPNAVVSATGAQMGNSTSASNSTAVTGNGTKSNVLAGTPAPGFGSAGTTATGGTATGSGMITGAVAASTAAMIGLRGMWLAVLVMVSVYILGTLLH